MFVVVVLCMPQVMPFDPTTMNYAAPITGAVMLCSTVWYFAGGRRHYHGPRNVIAEELAAEVLANSSSTIYKNDPTV